MEPLCRRAGSVEGGTEEGKEGVERSPHLSFQHSAPAGRDESRLACFGAQIPIGEGLRLPSRGKRGSHSSWTHLGSPVSARSGLWDQGWVSLMYGKSPGRVALLLGLQLTGKTWRAPLGISSFIAYTIEIVNCRKVARVLCGSLRHSCSGLIWTLLKLVVSGGDCFGQTGFGVFAASDPVQRGLSNLRLHTIFVCLFSVSCCW